MNIYVGNVPYAATETDLEELFKQHGPLASVTIIRDHDDGRSKGFGFVEMENHEDGERAIEALDGHELMGRPLKVNPARPREDRKNKRQDRKNKKEPTSKNISAKSKTSSDGSFHNPYTFVPTPPREEAIKNGGFAGDFNPLDCGFDHASLNQDLWTGHIPIKITTVTPLVLLKDDGRVRKPTDPQVYDVHSRIPEPSLRGMLRSAYEVVTNSRYSSFRNDDRLAYRMAPGESAKLVPTIIKKDQKTGKLNACFYTGTTFPKQEGPQKPKQQFGVKTAKKNAMYAAMLTLYKPYTEKTILECNYKKPKTGDQVYAVIVLCEKHRYLYWKAIRIGLIDEIQDESKLSKCIPNTWKNERLFSDPNGNHIVKVVEGTVFITNENIDKKHDERIFFLKDGKHPQSLGIDEDYINNWKALIQNYRDAHTDDDIFNRKDKNDKPKKPWDWFYKKDNSKEYAWSPHLYHRVNRKDRWGRDVQDALDLKDGTMVYARCKINDKTGEIKAIKDLFPVMISRELYECSPKKLLDKSLRPAKTLDDLSPADRLFGWTSQEQGTDGGYKSRIRVVCEDGERPDILEKSFENDPLPLSILGEPKPEQGRFYVAADDKGTPQKSISKQQAGYDTKGNKHLRGRKHYWHHKGFEYDTQKGKDHWNHTNNQDQEYIRKGKTKDTQNRSITGWIKPGESFKVSLYVQNLEPEEVGALLWLLTLPEDHYYKLGYGKPLGFGSVKIEIDTDTDRLENGKLPIGNHDNWKEYYKTLVDTPPAKLDEAKQNEFIDEFKDSILKAYQQPKEEESKTENVEQNSISSGSLADQLKDLPINPTGAEEFDRLPFIQGFLRVLQGPDDQYPIHYPRKDIKRHPDGKNFEWFVQNEKGKKRALPDVNDENGLPYKP